MVPIALWAATYSVIALWVSVPSSNPNSRTFSDPSPISLPLRFLSVIICPIKSNQIKIKSLLLSHHHSTSALVSEILMSVLQTVQKNNRQFTYGQTVQKSNSNLHMDRQCKKNNNSNLHMDRQCKKKQQQQFTYGQTVQKSNSNLHMDSTYYRLYRRQCAKYTYIYSVHIVYYKDIIINDTLYTVWAHLHYVQYLYIM